AEDPPANAAGQRSQAEDARRSSPGSWHAQPTTTSRWGRGRAGGDPGPGGGAGPAGGADEWGGWRLRGERRPYLAWDGGGTATWSVERYSAAAAWRRLAAPVRWWGRMPSSAAQRVQMVWKRSKRAVSPRAAPPRATAGRRLPTTERTWSGLACRRPAGRSSPPGVTT